MAEYCPHAHACPFYQNWAEQTGSKRINIILTKKELLAFSGMISNYYCLALVSLNDKETGLQMGNSLKGQLLNPNEKEFRCSHITLLNRLED